MQILGLDASLMEGTGREPAGESRIRDSPSVQMAVTLVLVYVGLSIVGGSLVLNPDVAGPFMQYNRFVWQGWVWMLFTAMFLHVDLVHLAGNVLFLLVFGTSLEEQVSRVRWWTTYLASGLAGNLAFLFIGPFLGQEVAVGASGAVWGLLGAAGGLRGTMAIVIFAGFNIFAGGGFLAHAGGLVMGLFLRQWWDDIAVLLKGKPPEFPPPLPDSVSQTFPLNTEERREHCFFQKKER